MATSYVHLLLLILSSLLFLPALCAIDFEYCNKNGYDFGNFSRVEFSPNPLGAEDDEITITVFGYASRRIDNVTIQVGPKPKKTTHDLTYYYMCKVGDACVFQSSFCSSEECPIEAGKNFVLPITNVFVGNLEGDVKFVVSLHEDDVEHSVDYDEKLIELMCIDFVIPLRWPDSDPKLDSA